MSTTPHTLVTGATGTLGQALLPRLRNEGHRIRATSRSPPPSTDAVEWVSVDLAEGNGIQTAVEDVDVVVHTATAPRGKTEAVDVRGTKRLLDAAADVDVSNLIYVSIVGIKEIPYSYYDHKLTAERAVERSAVPATVFRSTQFYPFVHDLLETIARLPIWPLPTELKLQPIDVGTVADRLVEHATPNPGGRLDPIGGPAVRTVGELAGAYRDAIRRWHPIVPLPALGETFSAIRDGAATCPDHAVGTVTWEEWLDTNYDGVTLS